MAKFCTNCGKKLKDGEVCDCTKTNEVETFDVNGILKKSLEVLKGIFTKPVDTLKKYVKGNDFLLSVIFVVIAGISTGLLTLALVKVIMSSVATALGYGLSYGLGSISNEIPYFRVFLVTAIISVGIYFLEALVLWLITGKCLKEKVDYKKAFNLLAPISIYTTVAMLLSILGAYISLYIVIALIGASGIMNLVSIALGVKEVFKVDANKVAYVLVGSKLITLLILVIIAAIF